MRSSWFAWQNKFGCRLHLSTKVLHENCAIQSMWLHEKGVVQSTWLHEKCTVQSTIWRRSLVKLRCRSRKRSRRTHRRRNNYQLMESDQKTSSVDRSRNSGRGRRWRRRSSEDELLCCRGLILFAPNRCVPDQCKHPTRVKQMSEKRQVLYWYFTELFQINIKSPILYGGDLIRLSFKVD